MAMQAARGTPDACTPVSHHRRPCCWRSHGFGERGLSGSPPGRRAGTGLDVCRHPFLSPIDAARAGPRGGQGEGGGEGGGQQRARIKSPNPQGTRLWRRVAGEIEGRFDARVLSSRQRGGAAATGHAPNKATGHAQQRTPICRGATWTPAQPTAASPRA